jgi:nucleoside phosphorylase
MIIVLNPIQCPDINISLGKIIIAENITEWDRKETRVLPLFTIEPDNRFSYIGKGVSGDRECTTKTTLVIQSKFVDCITYPIAKVSDFFSLPVLSIGIVSDYCTQNFSKFLQSNIKELSTRLVEFIKPIISNILEG